MRINVSDFQEMDSATDHPSTINAIERPRVGRLSQSPRAFGIREIARARVSSDLEQARGERFMGFRGRR